MLKRKILASVAIVILTFVGISHTYSQESSSESTASFEGYIRNSSRAIVAAVFKVELEMSIPYTWADIYHPAQSPCQRNYPAMTNTVPEWAVALAAVAESQMDLTINTSFYAPNNSSYSAATCANNMGIAATSGYKAPTNSQDCNRNDTCHPIDAIFLLTDGTAKIVTSSDVGQFFEDNANTTFSAVGGIHFVQDSTYREEPALDLHRPNDLAARMAVGIQGGEAGSNALYIFYVPYGYWQDGFANGPGLKDSQLARLMISMSITDAVMFDGGGSATINLQNVSNWNGPTTLPELKPGSNYRPVGNALGFVASPPGVRGTK